VLAHPDLLRGLIAVSPLLEGTQKLWKSVQRLACRGSDTVMQDGSLWGWSPDSVC